MPWLQVSIETDGSAAEQLSEFLNDAGALSVTATDAGDEPLLEPAPGETPLWRKRAYHCPDGCGCGLRRVECGTAGCLFCIGAQYNN